MRLGLYLPNFGTFGDPVVVAALAGQAEAAGWDGLFLWDHVVRHEGDFDLVDPWVTLAAVAQATGRLRVGPLITPLPRRRPWNVARAATTLDHLSGGRAVLGVGIGSSRGPEFGPFGEEGDPRVRGDLLDEGLDLLERIWSGDPVVHAGPHYRVDGLRFLPRPLQSGGIPLWAATESTRGRAVRRAARLDGVFPIGLVPEQLPELLASIDAARPADRRDRPFDVVVAEGEHPGPWVDTPVTWWLRLLPYDLPFAEAREIVESGPPAAG